MPRYSAYGSLDDRVREDGDRGFTGFNNRLRPDQLEPGILANSENARLGINGEWQVRKGIDQLTSPVTAGANSLTLPFFLKDTPEDTTLEAVSSGNLVLTFSDHGLGSSGSGKVKLSGFSGVSVVPSTADGMHAVTITDANTLTLSDKTYTSVTAGAGAITLGQPTLTDGLIDQLYGSCPFTNPNVSASEVQNYIIIATNAQAFAVNINTEKSYSIGYESSQTISSDVSMLQAFNRVFIFRGTDVTLENSLKVGPITSVSKGGSNNTTITVNTEHDHFLTTSDKVTITGLTSSADVTMTGTFDVASVTDSNTFTYSVGGTTDPGTITVTDAGFATPFTKVASGSYSQPTLLAPTGFTITNGIATATVSNTLSVGNTIECVDPGSASGITQGTRFEIATASSSQFTFKIDSKNITNQTDTAFMAPQSVSGGFSHMPAAEFGHYHQRRLVLPFKNSVDASTDSYTYRQIQDELIFSDILDSDTYDPIFNQFRFNAGRADRIMGLHSFSEDILMVFNRNSIHLVANTTDLKNSTNKLLTDEIGLLAKDSIQQIGNQILFLSDNGVYGVGFIEDYKLRGTEIPLSESIQSTINRINTLYSSGAQSVYFDNRYYLAVPLDQSNRNNALIIYNFLNKQWESIDSVNSPDFHITNMFVAGEADKRGVYITNDVGGINRLEARASGVDRIVSITGGTVESIGISATATTRQFTLGKLDRKKWKSFEMHVESSPDNVSDFDISIECENIDRTISLGTLNGFNNGSDLAEGEDISIRGRMGNPRAYGVQFTINNTTGRPRLRALKTDGIESFRTVEKAI